MDTHQFDIIQAAIGALTENPKVKLDELAQQMGYSPFHLQRLFKQWAGVTPQQFSRVLRKNHALQLLDEGLKPQQVSADVGYESLSTLHQLTVQLEAMTPAEISNKGQGLTIRTCALETPFGPAFVANTEKGICNIEFETEALNYKQWKTQLKNTYSNALHESISQADCPIQPGHFDSLASPKLPQVKLYVKGTAFQVKVWEALLNIPAGELRSYGQIANQIHHPSAHRAVGTAVASNQIAFLIPCHRVIQSTGELGQYRWGMARKKALHVREFWTTHPSTD